VESVCGVSFVVPVCGVGVWNQFVERGLWDAFAACVCGVGWRVRLVECGLRSQFVGSVCGMQTAG
jgi:hypothetical protein